MPFWSCTVLALDMLVSEARHLERVKFRQPVVAHGFSFARFLAHLPLALSPVACFSLCSQLSRRFSAVQMASEHPRHKPAEDPLGLSTLHLRERVEVIPPAFGPGASQMAMSGRRIRCHFFVRVDPHVALPLCYLALRTGSFVPFVILCPEGVRRYPKGSRPCCALDAWMHSVYARSTRLDR